MIEIQTGGDVVDDTSPQLGGDLDTNSILILHLMMHMELMMRMEMNK